MCINIHAAVPGETREGEVKFLGQGQGHGGGRGDRGQSYREIVRQQYNFSPPEAIREVEDYDLNLDGVTALELTIIPDISGGSARASLAQWRVA